METMIDRRIPPEQHEVDRTFFDKEALLDQLIVDCHGVVPLNDLLLVANTFYRHNEPEEGILLGLMNILDDPNRDDDVVGLLPTDEEIVSWTRVLKEIADGHEAFLQGAPEVQIPIASDLTIQLIYGPSKWEGVGAVYFFGMDFETPVPLFSLRGNPLKSERGFDFNIRALQPWVSEYTPSLKSLHTKDYNSGVENKSRELEDDIDRLLQGRRRMIRQLENTMNRGNLLNGRKEDLTVFDSFFLLGISYLQAAGVTSIRGINDEKQPEHYITDNEFCYDGIFSKWAEAKDSDEQYPWVIYKDSIPGYIPRFHLLPPGARKVCLDVFTATKENRE